MHLDTANGQILAGNQFDVHVPQLNIDVPLLHLKQCPNALSIGHRVLDQDYEFHWTKKRGAWYTLPDGKKVYHEIIGRCPYLTKDSFQALAVASRYGSVAVLAADDRDTEFFNIHSDHEDDNEESEDKDADYKDEDER